MKTIQTKIDRSGAKWLPGAMAIAATTASSQAATVQITLSGNKISSTSAGGNSLNADLTGDGLPDSPVLGTMYNTFGAALGLDLGGLAFFRAGFASGGGGSYAAQAGDPNFTSAVGDVGFTGQPTPIDLVALNPVTFSDLRINGGETTYGWLEVHAFNESVTSSTVQLTRLIFDDASTTRPAFTSIPGTQTEWSPIVIPEPSSFALLGLGAAGVLARRRRQAA